MAFWWREGPLAVRVAASALILVALAASVSSGSAGGAEKRHKHGQSIGWRLGHLSFDRTLTYDDTLGDWLLSAGTMALRDRVQLMPPVPDRYGLFWSKKALETSNFEVTFTISATDNGEGKDGPRDGAVAFWLSPDPFAAAYDENSIVTHKSRDWYQGLSASGLTLLSNKPTFKGLAMVFNHKEKQTVGGFWNDGVHSRSLQDLMSVTAGAQTKAIDWMTAGTQVKVRVTPTGDVIGQVMTLDVHKHLAGAVWGWAPDGVDSTNMLTFQNDGKVLWDDGQPQGSWRTLSGNKMSLTVNEKTYVLRFEGSHRAIVEEPKTEPRPTLLYGGKDFGENPEDWQEVFRFPGVFPKQVPGYMGFSGHTGTKSYIEVDVHRIETLNYDERTVGEDSSDVFEGEGALKEWMETLEKEKRFVDQASQAEAVVRLTKLLSEHVNKCDKAGLQIKSDLIHMEERLDRLGVDMASYLAAAQAYSFEAGQFDAQVVRDHISDVKTVLTKGKQVHDQKMGAVHQVAKNLKESSGSQLTDAGKAKVSTVEQQARQVEEFAARGSTQTNGMLFMMVLSVAGLGCLFLNRMRYYEKKHYI